jgi:hypothetical protein
LFPIKNSDSRIHVFLDATPIIEHQDLIDTSFDDELSILDLFDPLKQSTSLPISPPESVESIIDTPSSPSLPYPIKFQLKLSACSEMKPFYQLVQQIRNEYQSKEVKTIEFF